METHQWDIEVMSVEHYHGSYALWQRTPGVGLSEADSQEGIQRFLERNPGLSFVCCIEGRIVGTVLGGHDGRRGYLHHVCVQPEFRSQGIGRQLVDRALQALHTQGIRKCHLFVHCDNSLGQAFWAAQNWEHRVDIVVFSRVFPGKY